MTTVEINNPAQKNDQTIDYCVWIIKKEEKRVPGPEYHSMKVKVSLHKSLATWSSLFFGNQGKQFEGIIV